MDDEGSRSDVAQITVLVWPKIELALKPLPKPSEILFPTLQEHREGFHPLQMSWLSIQHSLLTLTIEDNPTTILLDSWNFFFSDRKMALVLSFKMKWRKKKPDRIYPYSLCGYDQMWSVQEILCYMVFFPISLIDTDITFVCCNINELIFCLDNWLFNCLLLIYRKYLDSFFHFALLSCPVGDAYLLIIYMLAAVPHPCPGCGAHTCLQHRVSEGGQCVIGKACSWHSAPDPYPVS